MKAKKQSGLMKRWFGTTALPTWGRAVLARKGGELFVVGGAVRDALLGREGSRDLDVVVRGIPMKTLIALLRKHGRVDEVGRTFGVLKFVPRGKRGADAIDVALPRTDFSFGTGGYKDVETAARHALPLEKDLARRDFTVNAMAWDVGAERLIDPFGGERDLSERTLRAVGEPDRRFREDHTRILRLLRFATELGFSIEKRTRASAKRLVPHLDDRRGGQWVVPRELVAKELLKSLAADPLATFTLWDGIGAWRVLVPEIERMKGVPQPRRFHREGDVWEHTRLALATLVGPAFAKRFPDGYDAETALAVLLHDVGKPPTLKTPQKDGTDRIRFDGHDKVGSGMARAICGRLALASRKGPRIDVSADRVAWTVAHHLLMVSGEVAELRPRTIETYFLSDRNPGDLLRKTMYCDVAATINADGKPHWTDLRALERRIAALAATRTARGAMPKPLLDGTRIMRVTRLRPGPAVGRVVAELRDAQLAGKVRTVFEAERFVKALAARARA